MSKQTRQRELARLRARREAERRHARRRRALITYGSLAVALLVAGVVVLVVRAGRDDRGNQPAPAADARADAPGAPAAVACGGRVPPRKPKQTYSTRPPTSVKPGVAYTARVETSCGGFSVRLDPRGAPVAVSSFVFLARQGFYDSTWFHRIVPGGAQGIGVIQGGDPQGDGGGGPGYRLPEEPPRSAGAYKRYTVAMAKSQQPDSTGSQFFVNTQDNSRGLAPDYTLIGEVTSGRDVVDRIAKVPVGGERGDTPTQAVWIEKLTVTGPS
ncbi:MAG TPA: peptidylprolyl isomerase [Actinomycetes bacterium]|nr:peptidylprolyl isomerase [Actinomycetes bacterium]